MTRILSRPRRALVSALAISAGLVATQPSLTQGSDTLVIARSMDVNSLDPARAFCDTCQIVVTSRYDRLVDLGADNTTIEPQLAESWVISEDMQTFTFNLAQDRKFADGSDITTDDIIWSLERVRNLKGAPSFIMDGVTSITAADENTIVITLAAPDSEFLNKMTGYATGISNRELRWPMVPKAAQALPPPTNLRYGSWPIPQALVRLF